jgi:hypothetical protein
MKWTRPLCGSAAMSQNDFKTGVSHLLHTRWVSHLRAFLDKIGNVEGEVLDRLIDRNGVLPGCGRPDAVVIFLQPAQQTHPGLRVGPTPVLAPALFPQIPQGLIPVVVKKLDNLIEMIVFHCLDILAQLLQSELRLRFAVRMVKESDKLPNKTSEAMHKPFVFSFQFCHGLLFLHR